MYVVVQQFKNVFIVWSFLGSISSRKFADSSTYEDDLLRDSPLAHLPPPVLLTPPQTFQRAVGDDVTFPCLVSDLGTFVLLWKTRQKVLTAGQMIVDPDRVRYKLVDGFNLHLRRIRASDGGHFSCSVATFGKHITVTHKLEVLIPPSIETIPADGNYVIKKGERAHLKCKAIGNPEPQLYWSRENSVLPSGETQVRSSSLVLNPVDRHSSGNYTCIARNRVGEAMLTVRLEVLFPPEIQLEMERVHSGENKEAHLTCLIHGNPQPTVRWYRDNNLLVETATVKMNRNQDRHTLILRSVRAGLDFGNYSCVADNGLGTFKKYIEVHGRPSPAVFRSNPHTPHDQNYNLIWSVDSYSPVEEYRLLYRKIKPFHKLQNSALPLGGGDWTSIIADADRVDGFTQIQSQELKNLSSDSEYECLVQARNRFGWSDASRLFRFYTSSASVPTAQDLGWLLSNGVENGTSSKQIILFIVTIIILSQCISL